MENEQGMEKLILHSIISVTSIAMTKKKDSSKASEVAIWMRNCRQQMFVDTELCCAETFAEQCSFRRKVRVAPSIRL